MDIIPALGYAAVDDRSFLGSGWRRAIGAVKRGIAMIAFRKMLALVGIALATCIGWHNDTAAQTSKPHGILHRAGSFHGAHVDRQGGRLFQKEWT